MTAPIPPVAAETVALRAPREIVLSFYLWWIPIIVQGIILAYIGLTLDEAARIGGPAWDVLLEVALPAVIVTTLTTAEITCVFLVRRGWGGARIALIVIGGLMILLMASQLLPQALSGDSPTVFVLLLFAVSTICAILAMTTPPANAFFRTRQP